MQPPIINTLLKIRIIDALNMEMTALQDEMLDEPSNSLIKNQHAEIKAIKDYLDGSKKSFKLIEV